MKPPAARSAAFVAALMLAVALHVDPVRSEDAATPPARVDDVVDRLAADPVTPAQYSAKIALHVRLRVFPFIRITLHGDSTYTRPGLYHFVFRGVPKVAEKFGDLNYDLGDPKKWPARYEIALAPQSQGDAPVVRLTPKVRGMVKWLDVSIDMSKGHMVKAVWTRYDGGTIVLVQQFVPVGEREIVSRQTASIDIPHMRADVSADYGTFVVDGQPVVAGIPAER